MGGVKERVKEKYSIRREENGGQYFRRRLTVMMCK